MPSFRDVQPALAYTADHLDTDLSLSVLAAHARMSTFHLHRSFRSVVGETPKQFSQRLKLSRAAALLLTTTARVLDIALACGFSNHETFSRAFRRRFGLTPGAYRKRGFTNGPSAPGYAALVDRIAPCIGLHHIPTTQKETTMPYSIQKIEIDPQPILLVRERVNRSDIAATIPKSLGHIFAYAQQHGVALSPGHPLTRYIALGPGMVTMEPAMRIPSTDVPPPDSPVTVDSLPGGLVATTTHMGPYETLIEAYAALEQWIDAEGYTPTGAPWESYITDPAEHPDPKDWRTDIFWPITPAALMEARFQLRQS